MLPCRCRQRSTSRASFAACSRPIPTRSVRRPIPRARSCRPIRRRPLCCATPMNALIGRNVDALVPDAHPPAPRVVPRMPTANTRRRGRWAAQIELVARRARWHRGDGRDRAQPAAGPGPALDRRGDSRRRCLPAGSADDATRPLQPVRRRSSAALAVDARDPQVLFERLPSAVRPKRLHVDVARFFLLEPNRLEFRVAAGIRRSRARRWARASPNRADTIPGFVVATGPTGDRRGLPQRAALRGAAGLPRTRADQRAGGAAVGPRAHRSATLSVRSRQPRRFGVDEHAVPRIAGQPAGREPAAGAVGGGRSTMRSGWRASASSPAASRTTSTTC